MRKDYIFMRDKNFNGINKHQRWIVLDRNGHYIIEIMSNEDVLGDKWYMTSGEGSNTQWYHTKQKALERFLSCGEKAIYKKRRGG